MSPGSGELGPETNRPEGTTEAGAVLSTAQEVERVPDRNPDLTRQRKRQENTLSRVLGWWALIAVTAQIAVADVSFIVYGFYNEWAIPSAPMVAWLSATVVQVVGIVLVITKSLYPSRLDPGSENAG